MIDLTESAGAIRLRLKVQPSARRDAITGEHAGALKIAVTAAPERGKANRAVLELLARSLGLRKSDCSVLRGETSPEKVVELRGSTAEEVHRRLTILLDEP